MKKLILLIGLVHGYALLYPQPNIKTVFLPTRNICPAEEWYEIFADDFDGNSLNTDYWYTYAPCADSTDNCKASRAKDGTIVIYKDENVVVEDGNLKIFTRFDPSVWFGTYSLYTSGMIYARPAISYYHYRKYEARIKIPPITASWPAFWCFGWNDEIDFFEVWLADPGRKSKLQFNIHQFDDPDHDGDNDIDLDQPYAIWVDRSFFDTYHTFATEHDPYFIRFFLDGVLMYTINKLNGIVLTSGGSPATCCPVTSCNIRQGYYAINRAYPHDLSPRAVIVNNALQAVDPNFQYPLSDTSKTILKVDYIRMYSRDCPWSFGRRIISADEVINYAQGVLYDHIEIMDGRTLTISNSAIQMVNAGSIRLGKNARLILNNTSITSCNPNAQWSGITAGDDAVVEMHNHSLVENATIGVTLGDTPMNGHDPSTIDDNPVLVADSYSGFKNCGVGVYLGAGRTHSVISGRAWFDDNETAILAESSSGLIMDGALFHNNDEAVRAIDSYMHIRDDNRFYGGNTAISVEGTYPGGSAMMIGSENPDHNNYFFDQADRGVDCSGATHPVGAKVVNCRFSKAGWYPASFSGDNILVFANNTVDSSTMGFTSVATGDHFNSVECNVFRDIGSADMAYAYNNRRSQFLGNLFIRNQNINCGLIDARLAPNIGTADNPAGNCFSGQGSDIVTLYNSSPFNYHYYDDTLTTMCQEPINPGNYTKVRSLNPSDNCHEGVGIFKLIDPDGDGVRGFIQDTIGSAASYHSHISPTRVQDSIAYWIRMVVTGGGDDPTTVADETTAPGSAVLFRQEETLDQWIRYAVLRGMDTGDYAYADSILTPLKKASWQRLLFGLKVQQGLYAEAAGVLSGLPSRDTDEAYFKEVQSINIKRLTSRETEQYVTTDEVARLEVIAMSHEPSSAYARSLYRLLTGDKISSDLTFVSGALMAGGNEYAAPAVVQDKSTEPGDVTVYPNPAGSVLNISSAAPMVRAELVDMAGRVIMTDKVPGSRFFKLDLKHVAAGMYTVRITDADGKISNHRASRL